MNMPVRRCMTFGISRPAFFFNLCFGSRRRKQSLSCDKSCYVWYDWCLSSWLSKCKIFVFEVSGGTEALWYIWTLVREECRGSGYYYKLDFHPIRYEESFTFHDQQSCHIWPFQQWFQKPTTIAVNDNVFRYVACMCICVRARAFYMLYVENLGTYTAHLYLLDVWKWSVQAVKCCRAVLNFSIVRNQAVYRVFLTPLVIHGTRVSQVQRLFLMATVAALRQRWQQAGRLMALKNKYWNLQHLGLNDCHQRLQPRNWPRRQRLVAFKCLLYACW